MADNKPRYTFIRGAADGEHDKLVNAKAEQGYKATLMTVDESRRGSNQEVIVLMERET